MRKGQFVTTLSIHACPNLSITRAESILETYGVHPVWDKQELVADSVSGVFELKLSEDNAADLASELYSLGTIYFEINQRLGRGGVLFMGVPGLGVYRGELNEAGSVMLSEDRINQMMETSSGNHREFMRLLRVSFGQSWDDIIEPFRGARFSDNVVLLNRAG